MTETTKRHRQTERFHQLLAEIGALHDAKQEDYGTNESPFANLEASEGFGVPPWLGTLIRLNDKVARLKTFARTRKLRNEGVADNAKDIGVYALAFLVLFEDWTRQEMQIAKIAEIRPNPISPGGCSR